MAGGLTLTGTQIAWLVSAWVVFFFVPALWIARRAKRDGERGARWVFLTLVTGPIGVVEYFEFVAVKRRREKRGEPPE